ncbi:MAG: bile acid:sodium symporter [Caldilineaceae bacterium]|nr:bile acid:sodium symporter [Caldilineaceae bacterium]
MQDLLSTLFNLVVLVFVLSSMLGLGLSLRVDQLIAPLRNYTLMGKALIANFILAPALAYLLTQVIGLDQQYAFGLIILGVVAGAPMLAKYSELAKGDLAYTLGLMVLLQVVTIIFAPLILPVILQGAQVDTLGLLKSLLLSMMLPLAIGLFIKARYDDLAKTLNPFMSQASSIALIAQLFLAIPLGGSDLLGIFGTGALITALIFTVGNFAIGYALGGPARSTRVVTGLGTSQRNVSAGMLIATQSFSDPKVLLMVLVGSIVMMIVNSLAGAEFGRHVPDPQPAKSQPKKKAAKARTT